MHYLLYVLHIASVKISIAHIISFPPLNPETDMEARNLAQLLEQKQMLNFTLIQGTTSLVLKDWLMYGSAKYMN